MKRKLSIVTTIKELCVTFALGVALSASIIAPVVAPLAIVSLAITQAACGSGQTIQSVLSKSGPLLDFLVSKGKLTQAKADTLKVDFADAGKCAADLDDTLDQIAKDDPDAKAKKRNAWLTATNFCWKPVLLRQNFAADPKIQKISLLVDAIFAAGVLFHSPSSDRAMAAPKDEKAFENDLKRRLEELEKEMKP